MSEPCPSGLSYQYGDLDYIPEHPDDESWEWLRKLGKGGDIARMRWSMNKHHTRMLQWKIGKV